jgi:hypothetical protein
MYEPWTTSGKLKLPLLFVTLAYGVEVMRIVADMSPYTPHTANIEPIRLITTSKAAHRVFSVLISGVIVIVVFLPEKVPSLTRADTHRHTTSACSDG